MSRTVGREGRGPTFAGRAPRVGDRGASRVTRFGSLVVGRRVTGRWSSCRVGRAGCRGRGSCRGLLVVGRGPRALVRWARSVTRVAAAGIQVVVRGSGVGSAGRRSQIVGRGSRIAGVAGRRARLLGRVVVLVESRGRVASVGRWSRDFGHWQQVASRSSRSRGVGRGSWLAGSDRETRAADHWPWSLAAGPTPLGSWVGSFGSRLRVAGIGSRTVDLGPLAADCRGRGLLFWQDKEEG